MKISPEQHKNFRALEIPGSSEKLIIVFTAMGTSIPIYKLFTSALNRRGFTVIIYDYPAKLVLDAEFDEFDVLYQNIKADADSRIERISPANTYVYGVSMGTLLAVRLVRDSPDIKHLVLSLTYGDVAENIMHSPATRKTRKTMQSKNLSIDDLRDAVKHFDPIKNVEALADKKVWLHLSKRDRVLDYELTSKTKQAMEETIADFYYTESKLSGHYVAGAMHMMKIKKLEKFFES